MVTVSLTSFFVVRERVCDSYDFLIKHGLLLLSEKRERILLQEI